MRDTTLPANHFEALYDARPDPWRLATSDYEAAKYAATLAALPRPRYGRAFEIGCAIGVLTADLASRCDDLLAVDPVPSALERARANLHGRGGVRFARMLVPRQWPDETFDLVVISEVIDYLGRDDVLRLARRVGDALAPGGDVLLVHWVGKKAGPARGGEASDLFIDALGGDVLVLDQRRNPDYRLDLLRRR